jgi:hypothetical protein
MIYFSSGYTGMLCRDEARQQAMQYVAAGQKGFIQPTFVHYNSSEKPDEPQI